MAAQIETTSRGPAAYELARQAVETMNGHGVWPTPLNYRLWLDYVSDPRGAVAAEIDRLIAAGEAITEARSEAMAVLLQDAAEASAPSADLSLALGREIETVAGAIDAARRTSETYGASLEGATRELAEPKAVPALRKLLDTLAEDTRSVKAQHQTLEQRLHESTIEASRLRDNLIQKRKDATIDALTGLPNRKAFDEALQRDWQACIAAGEPLALAMIDIDNFKRFNDTWGHQTGDKVLRFVAGVIARAAVAPRSGARYGGEEFAIVFCGEHLEPALICLEAVRQEVAAAVLKRRAGNEDLGPLTISAGVALLRPGESVEGLVDRADAALYAAKGAGRNQVISDGPVVSTAAMQGAA